MSKLLLHGLFLTGVLILFETYGVNAGLSNEDVAKFRKQVLDQSNYYRKKYNIPSLALDSNMNNIAQNWANHIASTGIFEHSTDNNYGENIYGYGLSNDLGKGAVDSWYNEILLYNINANEKQLSSQQNIHHLTQVLWKSSKKLGVGISYGIDGHYYVVANYDPPGNVGNNYKKNLPTITQDHINEVAKLANKI